jgi:NADH:ubiquinone reductase (H+-translocating)
MRIAIIGAGYAGLSCALRLAHKHGGRAEITLINGSESFVERIRLHEQAAGKQPRALPLSERVRGTGVRLRVGWVERVDLQGRTLSVGGELVGWDRLVLALGSHTETRSAPGIREHAHTLDAAGSATLSALLPKIAAKRGRVVIVGGGLTGIEAATELAEAHPQLNVKLVTRGELAPGFSERARAKMRTSLLRTGVEIVEQRAVRSVEPGQLDTALGKLPFDACVWAVGFVAPPLARELGLAVNERGQVWVDATLRSESHPHVYAVGDCAVLREPLGIALPMGCKGALPSGLHVANNIARALTGKREHPFTYREVPYCVSLGRNDGLLQLPGGGVVAGRLAARLKELICRGTLWALALEQRRARPLFLLRGRSALPAHGTHPHSAQA